MSVQTVDNDKMRLPGEVVASGLHGVEKDRVGRGHVDGVVQLPLVLVPDKILKKIVKLQLGHARNTVC